ncbi:MAG: cytochrome c biogenesis protein CcsA [Planctomycetes bacterium]|nr:cytochrome c biogenesis protein CcsA [Planctomycetota bacterium]
MTGGASLVAVLAACHGAALLVSAMALLRRGKAAAHAGLWPLVAALVLNSVILAGRWIEGGRPPFKTLYETLLFYPWCVTVVTVVLVGVHGLGILIPCAAGVSLAGLGYALWRPDVGIVNLPPALQSGWFVPHVVTYFVAYAALFVSFSLALLSLLSPAWLRMRGAPPGDARPSAFARHAHRSAVFGICALTAGLVMGGVWGKYAWGSYWSWDPKENWALVSWLAYVLYLHLRLMEGWRERRAMGVLVGAFCAVVFTYLGMSLLPASEGSLHVYQ